jgi:HEAT repeat protein
MRRNPAPVLLFALSLLMVLFLALPLSAKTKPKPQPQSWQVDGIVAALNDDRDGVKQLALEKLADYDSQALQGMVKPETVRAIGNLLTDPQQNSDMRFSAALALGQFGDRATAYIPEIVKLFKDELQSPIMRAGAAEALGNFGDAAKVYIPEVAKLLKDKKQDAILRIGVVEALGNFGDAAKAYIPEIANLLKDERQYVGLRGRAAKALGNFGDAANLYIPDLIRLIEDPKQDSFVRIRAIEALENLGGNSQIYIPYVLNLLSNKNDSSHLDRHGANQVLISTRGSAAEMLSNFGDSTNKSYIPRIANLLKDQTQSFEVRSSAAKALGNFGNAANSYIPELLNVLKENKPDFSVNSSAVVALSRLASKFGLEKVLPLINRTYEERMGADEWRFYAYCLSGGDPEMTRLLRWVARPKQLPEKVDRQEAVKTLEVFEKAWKLSEPYPELRADLAEKTALVVNKGTWQTQDLALLKRQYDNLKAANMTQAAAVQSAITSLEEWQWVMGFWQVWLGHALGWLGLMFAYPKSPMVQAIFFWNPWMRNFLGAGYVTFLLQWVPGLRRILFAPFQVPLLADARLEEFNRDGYFADAQVSWQRQAPYAEPRQSLVATFPRIQGQVILQGESGSGKTHFIRHLLRGYLGQKARRIVVYLPATRCSEGVIEAIQKKLHGEEIKDAKFLQSLIYSGALDICIDGLNEVSADTRAKITQFVESQFRGNILIATQPLEWTPPATAKTYLLHPLEPDQIERYLLSRQAGLPPNLPVRESAYEQACRVFLQEQLEQQPIAADRQTAQAILSNPMELSLAAGAIAAGHPPDLFHLRQQQYNLMAAEYHQVWHREFPLKAFAEATYQLWLTDKRTLPKAEFHNELACMEDEHYRMVISRQWQDADGKAHKEWLFRHDKIADFFLAQTFLGDSDTAQTRLLDHMGDSRFRGVYLLLATMMPAAAAADLRESLIHYAAETKDHTVSDEFVLLCAGAIARR